MKCIAQTNPQADKVDLWLSRTRARGNSEYRVSFEGNENVLMLVVMAARL
jgi:hypothetical protein